MEFDFSWQGLLQPGEANCFFDKHAQQSFQAETTAFSVINAWWLAECCRLIYRQEEDETGNRADIKRRQLFFEAVGIRETAFWQTAQGTQCALLTTLAGSTNNSFAVLVFRGTTGLRDWYSNLRFLKTGWEGSGRVHSGFYKALQPVWAEIQAKLQTCQCPIFFTGHSLGAALATLAAGLYPPAAVYTFGSPRVGDEKFSSALAGIPIYRVVNNRDVVATVPQSFLGYMHTGELHHIRRNGERIVQATAADIKSMRRLQFSTPYPQRRFFFPPEFLTDHAPVNYVVHLEREITARER